MNIKQWLTDHTLFMNNVTFLAQVGHFLAGYGIVLTGAFLSGRLVACLLAVFLIAYAGVKEFYFDANFELPKQTAFDNWLDFSMYVFGVIFGLVVTFWKLGFSLAPLGVTP